MQSYIIKVKIVVYISVLLFFSLGCSDKTSLEDQITIKVKCIDRDTKEPRTNVFDTIIVRKEGFGFPKRSYKKVGEYMTDSTGSVEIKVDRDEGYIFLLKKKHVFGSAEYAHAFTKEKLKNGQEVIIDVIKIE